MIDLKSSKLLENIGYVMTLFVNESIIIENEKRLKRAIINAGIY